MGSYIFYFVGKRGKDKQSDGISICMSTSRVFGVYGNSDTGKTTLIAYLVTHLTEEGYRVATVKQTKKEISMDTKNKDTWRHHVAGAKLVVFSSSRETDFLFHDKMNTNEIVRKISEFGGFDCILIEGADDPAIPKIQIGSGEKRTHTIATYKDNPKELLNLIKKELQRKSSLPSLSIMVNGKVIPLTKFPEQIITNTIVGMLCSLKGVQNIKEVSIQLKQ
jgi:molybdopterin-guanine dinucleotide biosynthesis protein MobB